MLNDGFKSLIVWKRSYDLALSVYKMTNNFPKDELYGLTSQMRRSAISVSANIAEGYQRKSRKEYIHFLSIAKGSLGEVETYLLFSKDLGYVQEIQFNQLETNRQEVGRLLRGLMRSLTLDP